MKERKKEDSRENFKRKIRIKLSGNKINATVTGTEQLERETNWAETHLFARWNHENQGQEKNCERKQSFNLTIILFTHLRKIIIIKDAVKRFFIIYEKFT